MIAVDDRLLIDFERSAEQITRALKYTGGTHQLSDVFDAIAEGEMQLWSGGSSVMITKIVDEPRRRDLHFFLVAGDMDEVRSLYSVVLDWGRAKGCEVATMAGRPGWERTFLADEGWTKTLIVMEKELGHAKK